MNVGLNSLSLSLSVYYIASVHAIHKSARTLVPGSSIVWLYPTLQESKPTLLHKIPRQSFPCSGNSSSTSSFLKIPINEPVTAVWGWEGRKEARKEGMNE